MKDEAGKFIGFTSPRYTQVPDELFDELLPDLSGAELKVLMYVIRKTFGWKKASDQISISQMERGVRRTSDGRVLDRGTGLSRGAIIKALRSLVAKNIVIKSTRTSSEKGYMATEYALNVVDSEVTSRPSGTPVPSGKNGLGGRGPSPEMSLGEHIPSLQIEPGARPQSDTSLVENVPVAQVTQENPQETKRQQTTRQQHGVVLSETEGTKELTNRGLTRASAVFLIRRYPERILEKIQVFDFLVREKSSLVTQNPAGYLRKSIEEDYAPPVAYLRSKHEVEAKRSVEQAASIRKKLEESYESYVQAEIRKWRASLTEEAAAHARKVAEEEAKLKLRMVSPKLQETLWEKVVESEIEDIGKRELGIPGFEGWMKEEHAEP